MSLNFDVEIKDTVKQQRKFQENVSYYQEAYLNNGGAYPVKFNLPLQEQQQPFPVGLYEWTVRNPLLSVDEYGRPGINRAYSFGNQPYPIRLVQQDQSSDKNPNPKPLFGNNK